MDEIPHRDCFFLLIFLSDFHCEPFDIDLVVLRVVAVVANDFVLLVCVVVVVVCVCDLNDESGDKRRSI
jgi:hypothetical protein